MNTTANNRHVVIWGASGHALVVADIVRLSGLEIVGFLDNISPKRKGEMFGGATVLGGDTEISELHSAGIRLTVIAVGDNIGRCSLARQASNFGFHLLTATHPSATLAADTVLGAGTIVAAGAVINPACRLGANAIINTCASIDHECVIGDGVHIAPGAHLAGRVSIGDHSFVGIGSAIKDRVTIGSGSVIGAGSVVLRDIPDGVIAYGNPARVVRNISR